MRIAFVAGFGPIVRDVYTPWMHRPEGAPAETSET
jgi:hypothetical protein